MSLICFLKAIASDDYILALFVNAAKAYSVKAL